MISLLAQTRISVGHSQESLAEAVGVSARTVQKWESGHSIPYPRNRIELMRVLGLGPPELAVLLSKGPSPCWKISLPGVAANPIEFTQQARRRWALCRLGSATPTGDSKRPFEEVDITQAPPQFPFQPGNGVEILRGPLVLMRLAGIAG